MAKPRPAEARPSAMRRLEIVEQTAREDANLDVDEQIRRRAYDLYLLRNGAGGSEMDDWLQAEAELRVMSVDRKPNGS